MKDELETHEEGPKCKREKTTADFYNEIIHSDEEVLDTARMSSCCNRRKAWLTQMLKQGRALCAQELNITSFITAARCGKASQSMLGQKTVAKLKKRKIQIDAKPGDKYRQKRYKLKFEDGLFN